MRPYQPHFRRASALVLAMIFVVVLSVMALALASVSSNTISVTSNERGVHRAQANAESGLEYIKNILSMQVGGKVPSSAENLTSIKDKLRAFCANTSSTTTTPLRDDAGKQITDLEAGVMKIGGSTFRLEITQKTTSHGYFLHVASTGLDDSVPSSPITRTVSADFYTKIEASNYFDDGLYTNGCIVYNGTPDIRSKKNGNQSLYMYYDPATGKWYDGASLRSGSNASTTITQKGNSVPDGGFWVTGSDGKQVSGYTGSKIVTDYVAPHMPTFDPTVFSDLAPNVYSTSMTSPYTNVRIPANSGTVSLSGTFRGILYVEGPGTSISFNDAVLNCAIVIADKDKDGNKLAAGSSSLTFNTQVAAGPIPDELLAVKNAVAGYGILAPTANLTFSGANSKDTQTIYGSIICNTLDWGGGSDFNLINGAIIVLSSSSQAVSMSGNSSLTMWKDANFVKPTSGLYDDTYPSKGYLMVPTTYVEEK